MAPSSRSSNSQPNAFTGTRVPLLPSWRYYYLSNLELASNSSQEPTQALTDFCKPSYENFGSEINASAEYCKENAFVGRLELQKHRYKSSMGEAVPVNDCPSTRYRNLRVSSLQQRVFHHQTYKASQSPASNLDPVSPAFLSFHSPTYLRSQALLAPHRTFYESQPFWLTLYFCFNLGLTLYNKGVLVQFPFPYTLTALHALCGSVGGYILVRSGAFVPARLSPRETIVLVAFSVLYAVNIVISNVSLHLVTVPVSK